MKNIKVEFEYKNCQYKATAVLDNSFELNTRSRLNSDVDVVEHYGAHAMSIAWSFEGFVAELHLVKMGVKLISSHMFIFEYGSDMYDKELNRDEFKFNCRFN